MGIMGMIAQKKSEFSERIRAHQNAQYASNLSKLDLARKERAELETRETVRKELEREKH